jgi:hypothetical protein
MNSDSSKLRQQQEQVTELQARQDHQGAREFSSAEEMIRFDALQTPPPESLAERLKESITREPPPRKTWWQRLFGRRT